MELPVFNDNLKSSGSWVADLDREREVWRAALSERGAAIRERLLLLQRDQIVDLGLSTDGDRLLRAMRDLSDWATDAEFGFTPDRLVLMHRTMTGATADEEVIRKTEPLPLNSMHDPTPAILVPRMLDNAFDWFGTQSFAELHPVEQASVVYLRLLDIHPFMREMELSAMLAAGYYTQRAGLPLLAPFADEVTRDRYQQAVEAAFRMLTQPLVEFFAESLSRTMRECLQERP